MFDQQKVPVSTQVDQLVQSLNAAFTRKLDAETQAKDAETQITAIRNVLAGIQLGQQLQQEIDAKAKKAEPTPAV